MKAALVTGSSKGIGRATAKLFRKQGYFVYLHGRNEKDLQQLEQELGQTNSVLIADMNSNSDVDRMVLELQERTAMAKTQIEVLVNNAGIFDRHASHEARHDLWNKQMQVNLLAPVRLTEQLLPMLRAHAPAAIVNVSSTLGLKASNGMSAYAASKAALNLWTQCLALELGPLGVRVNAVCPGIVDTPIHDFHALPPAEKEKLKQNMSGIQPLGRIGEPEEIAEAIWFLASPASKWTTGALFSVDGGINLV